MNNLTQLEIRELKTFLQALKPETVLCPGFGAPHSYHGCWSQIAFVPQTSTTAGELLRAIEELMRLDRIRLRDGREMEFIYEPSTLLWISTPGHHGIFMTFESLLMTIEDWMKIGEGFERTH